MISACAPSISVPRRVPTYGPRRDVVPMVGLAVQLRALVAAGCDALVATGVTPTGVWR
jgi:hypothetical protein